uniref:Putative secreted protein n=1 Tax=Anopheles darlingi TaxID=43151 RepID=A0A2M4DJ97_ANODA
MLPSGSCVDLCLLRVCLCMLGWSAIPHGVGSTTQNNRNRHRIPLARTAVSRCHSRSVRTGATPPQRHELHQQVPLKGTVL